MTNPNPTTAEEAIENPSRPELQRLLPMAGTFQAKVTIFNGPGNEMVLTGLMKSSFQLDGQFLHQDYQGDPVPGWTMLFRGKGYWGYNPTTRLYEGFWIDTASAMMQLETGTVDASGKIWTMHSQFVHPANGQTIKKRSLIEVVDEDHHRLDAYFTIPDGTETLNMSILYSRVANDSRPAQAWPPSQ